MSSADGHVADWLKLIRAEDLEIPGLSLSGGMWSWLKGQRLHRWREEAVWVKLSTTQR